MSDPPAAPQDPFKAGHLGELTGVVSTDLVDATIDAAGALRESAEGLRRLPPLASAALM